MKRTSLFRIFIPQVLILLIICAFIAPSFAAAPAQGKFYLVSTGVGDPDNITVRALKTIKKADLVFCDEEEQKLWGELLTGKEIHPRPAIRIHKYLQSVRGEQMMVAGQLKGDSPQANAIMEEVNEFVGLVKSAVKNGKTVALLESGDPAIYGPQIWMMEALQEIDPVIIPGVSSFNAANAALKKGLTFGDEARSAILTNGAGLREGYQGADSIAKLAANQAAMVFFTMHVDLQKLVPELRRHYPANTPVAIVIEAGYAEKERVIRGTLEDILKKTDGCKIPFSHLVYVGDFLKDHWNLF